VPVAAEEEEVEEEEEEDDDDDEGRGVSVYTNIGLGNYRRLRRVCFQ
jgi:hypothetical protein